LWLLCGRKSEFPCMLLATPPRLPLGVRWELQVRGPAGVLHDRNCLPSNSKHDRTLALVEMFHHFG